MKATAKKAAKKQLETSITDKFMQALTELGYDAEKLKKEVKKAGKSFAKKISKTYTDAKETVTDKLESEPVKKAVKITKAAKKDIANKVVEVEEEIAKATKAATKKVKETASSAIETLAGAVTNKSKTINSTAKRQVKKPVVKKDESQPAIEKVTKPVAAARARVKKEA